MGGNWSPQLDERTKVCAKVLPWWSGYDEREALARMLKGQQDKRPAIPNPMPHITAAYFSKVLKPNLHKCPTI